MIGNKPRAIPTKDRTTFGIQVSMKEESIALSKFDEISGIRCSVTLNHSADIAKGVIYIYDCDMNEFFGYTHQ